MFTRKLKNISRAEAKSLIENNGGKIVSNVTKVRLFGYREKPTNKKVGWLKRIK